MGDIRVLAEAYETKACLRGLTKVGIWKQRFVVYVGQSAAGSCECETISAIMIHPVGLHVAWVVRWLSAWVVSWLLMADRTNELPESHEISNLWSKALSNSTVFLLCVQVQDTICIFWSMDLLKTVWTLLACFFTHQVQLTLSAYIWLCLLVVETLNI